MWTHIFTQISCFISRALFMPMMHVSRNNQKRILIFWSTVGMQKAPGVWPGKEGKTGVIRAMLIFFFVQSIMTIKEIKKILSEATLDDMIMFCCFFVVFFCHHATE